MQKALLIYIAVSLLIGSSTYAQQYTIDTLQYQGTDQHVVNMVILADGYTEEELDYFVEDAKRFNNYFFLTEPFRQYVNYFNVFAIRTPSAESGAIHRGIATDCPKDAHAVGEVPARFNKFARNAAVPTSNPQTIFGSSFDNMGLHRLVIPHNEQAIQKVLKEHVPNHSQVVILVNSPFYGGSGGKYATATVNAASNDIAVHEIGHSFALLADEYWAGNQYAIEGPNRSQEADPTKVRWKNWVGTNGVGVYAYGAKASPSTWFRPHEYCKMQYLVAPFCNVCQEAFVETIHKLTNPIKRATPSAVQILKAADISKLSLTLIKPSPNTLKVEWYLNGELIDIDKDSIYLDQGMFTTGENNLKAVVHDHTTLVRSVEHAVHTYTVEWKIQSNHPVALSSPVSVFGDTLETCYDGYQVITVKDPASGLVYQWYDTPSGGVPIKTNTNFVVPRTTVNKTYYIEGVWKGRKSQRRAVNIKVLPRIVPPKKVKVQHIKASDKVLLWVDEKEDGRYNYIWSNEDGQPIYQYDELGGEFVRPTGKNNTMTLKRSGRPIKVFVQKVDKETTCVSERITVTVY
ncbi:M64 family metallopeptidase [Sphingobacterium sp. SYP-B4668]|uniref:M64 family metallopeptidase n=1 Tax=Sphingobacterium sp. SYP-B4668 TaxID=2996035 RepID=UPI0022DD0A62|nr:M64 family metallopeptidase [Sphingobacterium sp. SYP-B4668]